MDLEMFLDSAVLSLGTTGIFIMYMVWILVIFCMISLVEYERGIKAPPSRAILAACIVGGFGFYMHMSSELYRYSVHLAFLLLIVAAVSLALQSISAWILGRKNTIGESSWIDIADRGSKYGYLKDACLGAAIALLSYMHDLDDGFVPVAVCTLLVTMADYKITYSNTPLFLGNINTQLGLQEYHFSHSMAAYLTSALVYVNAIVSGEGTVISTFISVGLLIVFLTGRSVCARAHRRNMRHRSMCCG